MIFGWPFNALQEKGAESKKSKKIYECITVFELLIVPIWRCNPGWILLKTNAWCYNFTIRSSITQAPPACKNTQQHKSCLSTVKKQKSFLFPVRHTSFKKKHSSSSIPARAWWSNHHCKICFMLQAWFHFPPMVLQRLPNHLDSSFKTPFSVSRAQMLCWQTWQIRFLSTPPSMP